MSAQSSQWCYHMFHLDHFVQKQSALDISKFVKCSHPVASHKSRLHEKDIDKANMYYYENCWEIAMDVTQTIQIRDLLKPWNSPRLFL